MARSPHRPSHPEFHGRHSGARPRIAASSPLPRARVECGPASATDPPDRCLPFDDRRGWPGHRRQMTQTPAGGDKKQDYHHRVARRSHTVVDNPHAGYRSGDTAIRPADGPKRLAGRPAGRSRTRCAACGRGIHGRTRASGQAIRVHRAGRCSDPPGCQRALSRDLPKRLILNGFLHADLGSVVPQGIGSRPTAC